MKAVVRAVLEHERLIFVGALIEVVSQFVMDGDEVFAPHLDAHLYAQIVEVIDIPSAGVAYNIAIRRLGKERALPERRGEGRKAHRREEAFAVFRLEPRR